MRTSLLLLPALLTACGDKDPDPISVDDTGESVIVIETGLWIDTADTEETGSPDTADTGGDTGGDTGDPGPEDPLFESLSLYPDGLVVHPGATFELRLVGTTDGSEDVELKFIEFASSDESLATVDSDGIVTALAAGDVSLTAGVGELSTTASLTIDDSGTIRVRVLNAETGAPMASAKVKVEEGEAARTDTDGWATLTVETGEPLSVHAYLSGYMAVTVFQTVSRELTVPLQDADLFSDTDTHISGSVDFSGVDSGGGADMTLGLALPALSMGPLLLDPDELMSPDRELSIFGIDVSLPENLYLQTHAETYQVPARPGPAAVWTIAGPMPIGEVTSSLDGASDAFALIDAHIDEMSWGWSDAGDATLGEGLDGPLAPAIAMSASATITTGALPLGFSGDEMALVMVGETLDDIGAVALGLGTGLGEVELHVADTTLGGDPLAMAIAQVGGLGSGGAVSATMVELEGTAATLPDFQSVPEMVSFDPATHDFELSTDTRSDIVRVLMTGADRSMRMIYMNGGSQSGHLPDYGGSMGYGQVTWEVLGFETVSGTFEDFVQAGSLSAAQIAPVSTTSARVTRTITASGSGG